MKHIEDKHLEACFDWFEKVINKYPGIELAFHPPNGGKRNAREAARFKRQGVKAGVCDIVIPVAKCGYHGLFIELKAPKPYKSSVSKKQRDFIAGVNEQGNLGVVRYGFDEVKSTIENYWSDE